MGGRGTARLKRKDRNLAIAYIEDSSMLETVDSYVKDRELLIFK